MNPNRINSMDQYRRPVFGRSNNPEPMNPNPHRLIDILDAAGM